MVDWDGLENRCAFTGTVGSNPTLSATYLIRDIDFRETAEPVRRCCRPAIEPIGADSRRTALAWPHVPRGAGDRLFSLCSTPDRHAAAGRVVRRALRS